LRTLGAITVTIDIEYADGALMAHALLGDTYDLFVVVRKGDTLDGRREFPYEKTFSRLH
jgi:hypothetical protein